MKQIYNNDDLEKYRQVNGILNDEGQRIFCDRINAYLDQKDKDKEIERSNNIIKEQGLEDKPNYYVKGLEGSLKEYQEEVKRLNNIINELEKMMKNDLECACSMNENGLFNGAIDILEVYLDKLQELKGSDK